MDYQFLFGPVQSRRLGVSLGVDLVPKKVCTLNCVYCEVGKTSELTLERREYVPLKSLQEELLHYLGSHEHPDYLTFSGYGEPTLNSRLGELIHWIQGKFPGLKIALITNGTLLSSPEVGREIATVDLLMPSMDAASQVNFNKINRPHPALDFYEYMQSLIQFSHDFEGQIWLEVFFLPGFNYQAEELKKLESRIKQMKVDKVQLNTLDRPGTLQGIQICHYDSLCAIQEMWSELPVEIIPRRPKQETKQLVSEPSISTSRGEGTAAQTLENRLLQLLARRPCTLEDLDKTFIHSELILSDVLKALRDDGVIQLSYVGEVGFYQLKEKSPG